MEKRCQLHVLAALLLGETRRYTFNVRLVQPQNQYGHYREDRMTCACWKRTLAFQFVPKDATGLTRL
jgi:hypothetical protein